MNSMKTIQQIEDNLRDKWGVMLERHTCEYSPARAEEMIEDVFDDLRKEIKEMLEGLKMEEPSWFVTADLKPPYEQGKIDGRIDGYKQAVSEFNTKLSSLGGGKV